MTEFAQTCSEQIDQNIYVAALIWTVTLGPLFFFIGRSFGKGGKK